MSAASAEPTFDANELLRVARLIHQHDVYRGHRLLGGPAETSKEWAHFCISTPRMHLILNFSLLGSTNGTRAAVTALMRCPTSDKTSLRPYIWDGRFERGDVQVTEQGTCAVIGQSSLRALGGRYKLSVKLDGFRAEFEVTPSVFPYLANNIQAGGKAAFNWFAVPRSRATGRVQIADRSWRLDGATCYHDRNWGHFSWGSDFSWEWGYSLARTGHSLYTFVLSRISDRTRGRTFAQGLLIWRGRDLIRAFRSEELTFEMQGRLSVGRCFSLPKVARLLSSGTATDVPRRCLVYASADGDELTLRCDMVDVAQILVPNDGSPTLTVINEVFGSMRASGSLCGSAVNAEHDANFEFLSS